MRTKILTLVFCLASPWSSAQVLFDGYFKLLSGGIHIGYVVMKTEFDSKKKQFHSAYYVKTNELGGGLTESLKTISSESLEPISYNYTMSDSTKSQTIDGQVKNRRLEAVVTSQKKPPQSNPGMDPMNPSAQAQLDQGQAGAQTAGAQSKPTKNAKLAKKTKASIVDPYAPETKKVVLDLKKGVFFSNVLYYAMLRGPKGLSSRVNYDFDAIAEEDVKVYRGLAKVGDRQTLNGVEVLRVDNTFKDLKYLTFITGKGEVIATRSPIQGIVTDLVPMSSMATGNFPVSATNLKAIFGEVPSGTINPVAAAYAKSAPKPRLANEIQNSAATGDGGSDPAGGGGSIMKESVPVAPGQGIMTKDGGN